MTSSSRIHDPELHISEGQLEIQLGEKARTTRLAHELVTSRLHRLGPLCDGIEAAVVLAEAPRSVRLARILQRQHRGRWSLGGDNPALVQQKGYLLLALVKLALRPALHRP